MSVDQNGDQSPLLAFDVDRPIEAVRDASQVVGGQLPPVVVLGGRTDAVAALLLSVARGNQEAFVALQSRMAGLVRVNVRRVLRDASRSEAVTQRTFTEVLEDAIHFDPHRDSAQTWLLTRAHQRAMDELRSVDGTDAPPDAQGHDSLDHPHRRPVLRLWRLRPEQAGAVATSGPSATTGSNSHG